MWMIRRREYLLTMGIVGCDRRQPPNYQYMHEWPPVGGHSQFIQVTCQYCGLLCKYIVVSCVSASFMIITFRLKNRPSAILKDCQHFSWCHHIVL